MKNIIKTFSKDEFLNAKVYSPLDYVREKDWFDLKNAITKEFGLQENEQRVKDVAKYLNKQSEPDNSLTDIIRKLSKCFKRENIKVPPKYYKNINENNIQYIIEACQDENSSDAWLQGGNKRAIAYAMLLLKKEQEYQPIVVLW